MTREKLLTVSRGRMRSDDENFIRRTTQTLVTKDLKHDSVISEVRSINYLPKNGIRANKTNTQVREQRRM